MVVGSNEDLASKTLRAHRLNWISIPRLDTPMRVQVKIRHRHEPAWATLAHGDADDVAVATFDRTAARRHAGPGCCVL